MNQTNQTRPRGIFVQWLIPAASAVLPTHVYLFNVPDVIRAGDNDDARSPVSVAASFTDIQPVNIVATIVSPVTGLALALIPLISSVHSVFRLVRLYKANLCFIRN